MAKTQFKVVLDNVDLSKAQTAAIQKDINTVVAKHLLASTKKTAAAAVRPNYGFMIPPDWLGYWIKNFATLEKLRASPFKVLR